MKILRVVGQTEDGYLVLGGVYRFFETYGVPLDIIRDIFAEKRLLIAWDCFYEEATQAGIGHRKILSRMADALPYRHPTLIAIESQFKALEVRPFG